MIKRKQVTLAAIRPNAGIHRWYRARLNDLLREVRNEVLGAVEAHKHLPSQPIALDAHPLETAIAGIAIKWLQKLTDLGDKLARDFVKSTARNYDDNLRRQLRKHGFTAQLQLSDRMKEDLGRAVGMNVGLIRSIPNQYLAQVEKYVTEAVNAGFDLKTLTDNLEHTYHISRNRAKLIARDQANKANAVIERARRADLGITKAQWMHSGGAKEPRESHVKAHGKVFNAQEGLKIDGKYILPGEEINCGCVSKSILEI